MNLDRTPPPWLHTHTTCYTHVLMHRLFWFGWPKLCLWLTLLAIVINATSITLYVDLLINYEGNPTAEATLIYWPNLTALW